MFGVRIAPKPDQATFDKLLADVGARELLDEWALEFPVNLRWYAIALARKRLARAVSVAFATAVSLAAILGIVAFTLAPPPNSPGASLVGAQAGFAVTAVLVTLQLVSSLSDVKAHIGIFWEASANLKEALYAFEDRWRDRTWTAEKMIEFKTALRAQLRLARLETRRERAEYFKSLKGAADVAGAAMGAFDLLRLRRQEVVAARRQVATLAAEDEGGEVAGALDARAAYERSERLVEVTRRRLDDARFANEQAKARGGSPPAGAELLERLRRDHDDAVGARDRTRAELEIHAR